MQDLNINKPDFKYKDYIVDLLSLDMNIKDVRMIYDLKFLTPFIGLLISSFLYQHEYIVVSEIREIGKNSLGYAKNNNLYVEDLNSTNGVYVNTERIQEKYKLVADDEVKIGSAIFKVLKSGR